MSRSANAVEILPPLAAMALERLGADLRLARERRSESLRSWAIRLSVSVPTLRRMEAGDPTVGIGVYVTALWLVGAADRLARIAAPEHDVSALDAEVRRVLRRRAGESHGRVKK